MQKWLISTHEENGSEKRESSGKVGVGQRKQLLLALCKLARFELLIAAPDHRKKKRKRKRNSHLNRCSQLSKCKKGLMKMGGGGEMLARKGRASYQFFG